MQRKVTFDQVECQWLALRWLQVRGDELRMSGSSWNFESGLRDLRVRQ
jgi:hypothetical protein